MFLKFIFLFKDEFHIDVHENGESHQARLSFAAFHFLGDSKSSEIYVHCAIKLCDETNSDECSPECLNEQSRRKRLINLNFFILSKS